ncbi:MAG TPA: hypothetical protein PKK69_11325, partial [Ferruginibacter sp.]|nr:hypothetical protein [Ferruginibacter sp.]
MRKSILAIGIACCSWHMASAQQAMPSLGTEAFTLVRFLDKHHYQPRTWNDSSSALLFDHWLELLDDEHLLLLQSDRQLLETYRYQLDDEIRRKESVFFKTSVDLLFRRLHQVDSILQTVITRPVDYSKPETYQWSRTTDAASLTEMAQRWNAFVKWRILDAVMDEAAPDTGNISLKQPANFAQL